MNRRWALLSAVVAAVVTLSCTGVSLPGVKRLEVGETRTKEVRVPLPDGGGKREVEISMGAGRLTLAPGAEQALIEGSIQYNVAEIEPEVWTSNDQVRIRQGKVDGIPGLDDKLENTWNLKLGASPMALTLNVGAAAADVELGGLALTDLVVSQGASGFDLAFSEANQEEMATLRVTAGASKMTLSGLGNANAGQIVFKGGAGSYTLRFDGELRRDLEVAVDAGLGQVVIIVPEGMRAEATFEGAATDVEAVHEWARSGDGYTLAGEGAEIMFRIKMGIGSLELRNK